MAWYWICCRTTYGREFQKAEKLEEQGYEVYLPVRRTDIRNSRKRRTEKSPLYPCYFFIKMYREITDIHPIKAEASIVMSGDKPAEASEELIDIVKKDEDAAWERLRYDYATGDTVRVKSGLLKDYQGEILKLSKGDRAVIRELTTQKELEIRLKDVVPSA